MHKILLIDDGTHFREELSRVCQKEGWDLVTAPEGKIGLEKAWHELPSAILLRCELPRISGFSLLKVLKKNHRLTKIPAAIISEVVSQEVFDEHAKLEASADNYFAKPLRAEEVFSWAQSSTHGKRDELVASLQRISADEPKLGGIPWLLVLLVLLVVLVVILYAMTSAFWD